MSEYQRRYFDQDKSAGSFARTRSDGPREESLLDGSLESHGLQAELIVMLED